MRYRALVGIPAVFAALALAPGTVHGQWSDLELLGRRVERMRSGQGLLYACTNDGLYRQPSTVAESAWVFLGFAGQTVHDLLPVSAESLIVARDVTGSGADTVALWRSTDGGLSWTPFQNGFGAGGSPSARQVIALLGLPHAPGTILAAARGVHIGKSTDGGMTWKKVCCLGGLFLHFLTRGISTVWTGGESNAESAILRRSTDDGETWTSSSISAYTSAYPAVAMAFDPADSVHAFLGIPGGLFETHDNGGSWGQVSMPNGCSCSELGTRAFAPLRLYVNGILGQGSTVFKTDDGGASWTPLSFESPGHGSVRAILVHSGPVADTLFLGMESGVLRYVETEVVGVDPTPIPSGLELRMGPSPSPGTISLTFRLARASRATLRVLDMAGREVAVLLHGERPAGLNRLDWNTAGLPSGVYLLRLSAGGEAITRKALLVH